MGPLMRRYSPYRISAIVLLVGSVPLFLSAAHAARRRRTGTSSSALAWAAFVYSLFFSLVFTNIMWFTAIDRVGASRASLYANLQPFLGAVFALIVLSEEMTALQVVGGLVIGAALLARAARPPARPVMGRTVAAASDTAPGRPAPLHRRPACAADAGTPWLGLNDPTARQFHIKPLDPRSSCGYEREDHRRRLRRHDHRAGPPRRDRPDLRRRGRLPGGRRRRSTSER